MEALQVIILACQLHTGSTWISGIAFAQQRCQVAITNCAFKNGAPSSRELAACLVVKRD